MLTFDHVGVAKTVSGGKGEGKEREGVYGCPGGSAGTGAVVPPVRPSYQAPGSTLAVQAGGLRGQSGSALLFCV